jgi:hypothetical protein
MFKYRIDSTAIARLRRCCQKAAHIIGFAVILVLPVGIYRDNPDSTSLVVSGSIGAGRYASVLRDCSGPVYAVGNDYSDVALKAQLAVPPRRNSPVVFGFAWGRWEAPKHRYPISVYDYDNGNSYFPSEPQRVRFSYINPSFSVEAKNIGMGMGYISGDRPQNLSGESDENVNDFTWHLRFGDPRRFYFLMSINENMPLVSGGGYFDFGVGVGNRKNANLFLGFSSGLYDSPGFVSQFQWPMDNHLYLTGALRYGSVSGISETGYSIGLSGRL